MKRRNDAPPGEIHVRRRAGLPFMGSRARRRDDSPPGEGRAKRPDDCPPGEGRAKRENDLPPARFRLLKAIAVVMALLLVVPGVDAIFRIARRGDTGTSSGEGVALASLVQTDDVFAALEQVEEAIEGGGAPVSAAFSEEIGLPSDARDVRTSEDGLVVGYIVPGDSADVLEREIDRMESSGWIAVPLGDVAGATFVKAGGSLTWALVTCTQAGSETSVVARCMSA